MQSFVRPTPMTDRLYEYVLSVSLREPEAFRALREETAKLPDARMADRAGAGAAAGNARATHRREELPGSGHIHRLFGRVGGGGAAARRQDHLLRIERHLRGHRPQALGRGGTR